MNTVTIDEGTPLPPVPVQPPPSPESTPHPANNDAGSPPTVAEGTLATDTPIEANFPAPEPSSPPPPPPTTENLALLLAFSLFQFGNSRGITRAVAYAAAVAAMGQAILGNALRAAREVLGPLPHPLQRLIRDHVKMRETIQVRRARTNEVPDQYSPETRPTRFGRLRVIRFLKHSGEHREVRYVRRHCPVCRDETRQVLELNLPHCVWIACTRCAPKTKRSRAASYGPPPLSSSPDARTRRLDARERSRRDPRPVEHYFGGLAADGTVDPLRSSNLEGGRPSRNDARPLQRLRRPSTTTAKSLKKSEHAPKLPPRWSDGFRVSTAFESVSSGCPVEPV